MELRIKSLNDAKSRYQARIVNTDVWIGLAIMADQRQRLNAVWSHVSSMSCSVRPRRDSTLHFTPTRADVLLESFMFDALGYKSWLKTLDA